jgi:hypothetical protein
MRGYSAAMFAKFCLPTMRAVDILVMDNLTSYKDQESLDLLKNAGVTQKDANHWFAHCGYSFI